MKEECQMHSKHDGSWWEYDGRGIPLCRVCAECVDAKLSRYNPVIFTSYTEADIDEQIEPEEY
jgi:hypothetical protein